MTYTEFFQEMKNRFMGTDVTGIREHLAFQFNIEDEDAGGIFYVEVKDGQLHIEPYEYNDRQAIFISTPKIFLKMAEGKADPVDEFLAHRLKVEGDLDKAIKLKDIIDMANKEGKRKNER